MKDYSVESLSVARLFDCHWPCAKTDALFAATCVSFKDGAGLYGQNDAEGFIKHTALRLANAARFERPPGLIRMFTCLA